jgi:hypothetical protein
MSPTPNGFLRTQGSDDMNLPVAHWLRVPGEPEPFPIQEPPDPPENPDLPVREPDPEDPGQI